MCTTCGCGEGETLINGKIPHHHHHDHTHDHSHNHDGHHHHGDGATHSHAHGVSESRMVQVELDILSKNNAFANTNRQFFADHNILALNLVSSPGSGKTSLLARSITDLGKSLNISVIEGDQQTDNDAERIRKAGAAAIQVNTGKGCHLDAHMIGHALEPLKPEDGGVLFIENVGNLVCPAAFDLGEAHKVVILSVTEGEDKPIKYPDMFHAADLMILNKTDLLPYLDFDVEKCIEYARRINPDIEVIQLSATKGAGLEDWYQWISTAQKKSLADRPSIAETA